MASIVLQNGVGGSTTIQEDEVTVTNNVLTLPTVSGTIFVASTSGGPLAANQGGTGLTSVGASGNILTSNGTTWVSSPAPAAGVTSFNTRTGAVTLASADVTGALGYTPPQPNGTGASGTWAINVTGNAATVTNAFPSGTAILFYQAAAPTGWTQVSVDDYAVRITGSSGGTTGGTTAYSTVFQNQTPSFSGNNGSLGVNAGSLGVSVGGSVYLTGGGSINATTLDVNSIASHAHNSGMYRQYNCGPEFSPNNGNGNSCLPIGTSNAGGGGAHSHGFNNPSYGFSGSGSIVGSPALSGTISGSNGPVTLNVRYVNVIICSKN